VQLKYWRSCWNKMECIHVFLKLEVFTWNNNCAIFLVQYRRWIQAFRKGVKIQYCSWSKVKQVCVLYNVVCIQSTLWMQSTSFLEGGLGGILFKWNIVAQSANKLVLSESLTIGGVLSKRYQLWPLMIGQQH